MHTTDLFQLPGLSAGLDACCRRYEIKTAVTRGKESLSYEELHQQVQQWKHWLDNHLDREPVLVRTSNTLNSLCLVLGGISARCVPLFSDPVWKETETGKALALNRASWFLTEEPWTGNGQLVAEQNGFYLYRVSGQRPAGDSLLLPTTAFCRFTSGSTGFARCLQFTERAFLNAGSNWWQAARYEATDKVYCLAALNNGLAFNTSLLAAFFSGAGLVLHGGALVPSIIRKTVEATQPTVFIAFPLVYEMLAANNQVDLSAAPFRLLVSSSAPLNAAVQAAFREKYGLPVCNYYGLAEAGPCTFNDGNPQTLGAPLRNVSIKRNEAGQVLIRTNSMASAFLDDAGEPFSALLNEEGMYISKDTGTLTAEGQLVLTGRTGRNINMAGRKIDPSEIEQFILSRNSVQNVVVATRELGGRDILVAYVEGKEVRGEDIQKQCAAHLAPYKIPQEVVVLESFPRSSTGKLSLGTIQINEL